MPESFKQEPIRVFVALVLLSLLVLASLWVLRPFLPGILWGTMIVVASWPLMLRVQGGLQGRRLWAAVLMALGLLVVVVLPLFLSVLTLIDHSEELVDWVASLQQGVLAGPPAWATELPVVGERLSQEWHRLAAFNLSGSVAEHGREISAWMFAQAGSIGAVLLHFAVTLAAAVVLYVRGESAADFLVSLARRLAGERGEELVDLAGQAIRAVAQGILVTALFQSLLGGIGLLLAGLPFVSVLCSLMLMLCVAQIGPLPVLLPAIVWLFWHDQTWQGVVLSLFSVAAVTLDGVLRPFLIQRGARLPLLLILVGVIGGLIGFGLVGLFLGPLILALAHTLILAWIREPAPADNAPV